MMSRNSIFLFMGLCLIAGIFIAGCTQPSTPVPTQTVAPTVQPASAGMENPASVNCGNM
jgi:putative hemolysin